MKNPLSTVCAILLLLSCAGCDWFVSADRHIERAQEYSQKDDLRAAMIELQNALRSEPDNLRARIMLAELSLRAGDAQAAAKELERAEAAGARNDAQFGELSVRTQLALGKAKDVIQELDAGRFALSNVQRATYRARAQLILGQPQDAAMAMRNLLVTGPKSPDPQRVLAQAYMQLGDMKAATQELDSVLQTNPQDGQALLLRGTLQSHAGEYRKAIDDLLKARRNSGALDVPQQYGLLLSLAEAYLALDDRKAARQVVDELSKRAPDAQLTTFMSARLAMAEQDYSRAVSQARKVLEQSAQFQPAKLLLGAALFANGNLNQAQAELSELVAQAPQNFGARKLLAQVNLRLQRPDLALQALGPEQSDDHEDLQADALRGWANLQKGDEGTAVDMLERVAAAKPQDAAAQLDLALAYLSSGQADKALKVVQSTPAVGSAERRTALLIAAVASANGRDAARAQIDEAVRQSPQDPGVLNVAAAYLARFGDIKAARKLLEKAVALKPADVGALMRLGQIQVSAGDLDAARVTYERVLAGQQSYLPAQVMLARLDFAQNDSDAAIKRLQAVRSASANAVEARLLLAGFYLRAGKTSEAEALLNEAQAVPDAGARVLLASGVLLSDAGQYERALAKFRDAAKQDKKNGAALIGIARAQLALGNSSAARESAEQAANLGSVESAVALLTALDIREKRLDEAALRIRDAQKNAPSSSMLMLLQGDIEASGARLQAASDAYRRSYQTSPSAAAAIRDYQARARGRLANPTQLLTMWVEEHPSDSSARMLLGVASMENRDYASAITQFEVLASARPPNPAALNNLAWLYSERNDTRALDTAKRAYDLAPERAEIADTYAWVLLSKGRASEALPVLERVVPGHDVAPEIRYHYALALARSGKSKEALQTLGPLLEAHPDFSESAAARKLMQELRS